MVDVDGDVVVVESRDGVVLGEVLGEVVLGIGEVLLGEVLGVVPCVVLGAVSVVPPVGACVVLGVLAGSVAVACA